MPMVNCLNLIFKIFSQCSIYKNNLKVIFGIHKNLKNLDNDLYWLYRKKYEILIKLYIIFSINKNTMNHFYVLCDIAKKISMKYMQICAI